MRATAALKLFVLSIFTDSSPSAVLAFLFPPSLSLLSPLSCLACTYINFSPSAVLAFLSSSLLAGFPRSLLAVFKSYKLSPFALLPFFHRCLLFVSFLATLSNSRSPCIKKSSSFGRTTQSKSINCKKSHRKKKLRGSVDPHAMAAWERTIRKLGQ